jgi:hypothetical protein
MRAGHNQPASPHCNNSVIFRQSLAGASLRDAWTANFGLSVVAFACLPQVGNLGCAPTLDTVAAVPFCGTGDFAFRAAKTRQKLAIYLGRW